MCERRSQQDRLTVIIQQLDILVLLLKNVKIHLYY